MQRNIKTMVMITIKNLQINYISALNNSSVLDMPLYK